MKEAQNTKTENTTYSDDATVREWRGKLYDIDGTANSRHVDMCAYLMAERFDFSPNTHTGESEAQKWLMRIQSGSHWAMADGTTQRVLVEFLNNHGVSVEYTGGDR